MLKERKKNTRGTKRRTEKERHKEQWRMEEETDNEPKQGHKNKRGRCVMGGRMKTTQNVKENAVRGINEGNLRRKKEEE